MKYILLAGSVIFGITGIAQAVGLFADPGNYASQVTGRIKYQWHFISLSFTPAPGYVRILILSLMFFILYLIWQHLKKLGIGNVVNYILE